MYDLKPCPFCGGEAETKVYYWKCGGDELGLIAGVKCKGCGISREMSFSGNNVGFDSYMQAFDEAVRKWNQRT